MSKREWKLFIEDILESIRLIKNYVENMDFDDFKKDRKTIDAVVRNFEIIGEASRFIPGLSNSAGSAQKIAPDARQAPRDPKGENLLWSFFLIFNDGYQREPALLAIGWRPLFVIGFFFSDFRRSLDGSRGLGAGMP